MKLMDALPPTLRGSSLWDAVGNGEVRPLSKEDDGKTGALILDIVYLPHRKTPGKPVGARIIRADVGHVGKHYADLWVREAVLDPYDVSSLRANPFRVACGKGRLFLIERI